MTAAEPAAAAARAGDRQPEGRRRQDHDRDQSRHRARRHRRARADHRSRSAGQRLDRPRHRPPQPPRLDLRRADRRGDAARGDRRRPRCRGCRIAPSTMDLSGPRARDRPGARPRLPAAQRARAAQRRRAPAQATSATCWSIVRRRSICSPSTRMAAANAILVPLQCEFFALEGLSQLLQDRRAGARRRSIPS